jgi:hypothetical protein
LQSNDGWVGSKQQFRVLGKRGGEKVEE